MAKQKPFITDQQWIRLEPLRPKPKPSPKGGPKPRDNRQVFDGIIWVLPSGARWNHLPDRYPSAAGQDYSHGKSQVFGSKYGLNSCPNWTNRAS
jgi:hypothetical protein